MSYYGENDYRNYLAHYGVLGMKWGVRKDGYRSTGLRSAIARRQNAKVDKSFNDWNTGAKNREDAITIGKKRNLALMEYERNPNANTKAAYKSANRAYKKAIRKNTTYRKGTVKQEVQKDAARKYLSEAKKVKKKLDADPGNKTLKKQYSDLMSKHDVARASGRRAQDVAARRSQAKATIKRSRTVLIKSVVASAAIGVGAYYLSGKLDLGEGGQQKVAKAGWAALDIAKLFSQYV